MQYMFIKSLRDYHSSDYDKLQDQINVMLRQGWFVKDIKTESVSQKDEGYFLIVALLEHQEETH